MKVDIYKSAKSDIYVSVPEGTDIQDLSLPKEVLPVGPFKSSVDLNPTQPRVGIDQQDVIDQIETKGYAIHGAKVSTTIEDE
ncbi:DUF6139 family protein [Photobacterium salinisoli]|uniref:DUF6139 family protein n=1 Tax=Photobacterium salinisoli TaxID=1616783 RepID=UPI000EA178CE|nr:DUF6139 family protein [Photobacterium salinisoli]